MTGSPDSVVGRAVRLLASFGTGDTELGLAELSRRAGLPKSTAYRLLTELAAWGLVERTPRGVRLGIRLFELGQRVPRQRGLREAARPYLADLHRSTGSTVHLAVLDGVEVVYVDKLPGPAAPPLPSVVGGRMPAYCTGVGKALLAFSPPSALGEVVAAGLRRRTPYTVVLPGLLEREIRSVRRRGVAFDREESTAGIACAACPVLGPDGRALAAVSVTGRTTAFSVAHAAPAVRTAADRLSRRLAAVD